MPYDIRRDGPEEKPWCLYLQRTGRRLGCTTSHERAQAMIANIEAQKRGEEPITVEQRIERLEKNDKMLKAPESFYDKKPPVKSIEKPEESGEIPVKDRIEKEPSGDAFVEEIYFDRNQAVLLAMTLADRLGHSVGVKDSEDPDWPVIFIDLGSTYKQVSWHVPRSLVESFRLREFFGEWDGHSTPEKRRRIHLFLGGSPDVSFGEVVNSGGEVKSDGEGNDQTQDDQKKEGLEISSRASQEETKESAEGIDAELLVSYLPGIVLGDSTEDVSKLFELEKARHSIKRCMWCSEPPTKAFLWAEGMTLAWFCDKHATDWAKENKSDIVASHPLVEGEDPHKWARRRIDEHYHGSKKEVPGDDVCPQVDRRGGGLVDKFKQWWANFGEQVLEKAQEETYNCECIECGHTEESTEHCRDTCLSDGVKILLLDGRSLTIPDITGELGDGKELWLYSANEDGSFVPQQIVSAQRTRFGPMLKITLDSGKDFECTPDHLIMLRNGFYIRADRLTKNDALMPFYTMISEKNKSGRNGVGGYRFFWDLVQDKWYPVHLWVVKALNMHRLRGGVVHHSSFEKLNNNPDQLEVMSHKAHRELHSRHLQKLMEDPAFREMVTIASHTPEAIEKRTKSQKRWWASEEGQLRKEELREQLAKRWNDEAYIEKQRRASSEAAHRRNASPTEAMITQHENWVKAGHDYWQTEKGRHEKSRSSSAYMRSNTIDKACPFCGESGFRIHASYAAHVGHCRRNLGLLPATSRQEKRPILINHRVVQIEEVGAKQGYDIAVDGNPNFAIGAGVFVHNSCPECGGEMRRAERPGPGQSKVAWTRRYINDLSDSAFFYIESGGKKDEEGKTAPRSLRHLPYKDAAGKVDIPHVRNAIARASKVKDKDGKPLAESLVSSIQSRARKLLASAQGKFFTVKQADGKFRWFAVSSTAFLDRDVEIISQEALRKAVERKSSGDLGPLRFWHVPGAEFGTCDYRFLEDLCLIESGLWNDDPVATKVRRKVESDPDFFALSIGFIPNLEDIETGIKVNGKDISIVWNDIEILERSLLRADRASNRFTLIGTQGGPGMDMKEEQVATLKKLIGDGDLFTQFMGRVQAINAKATEPDAVFKGSTEADQDPLVVFLNKIKEGNPEAAVELEKAVKTLQAPEDPATTPAEVTANAVIQLMQAERLLSDETLKEELGAILVKIVTEEVKTEDKQETEEKQDDLPGDASAILKTLSDQLTTIATRLTALEKEEAPRAAAFRASEGGDGAEQKDADDSQEVGVPRVVQEISAVVTSRLGGM